MNLGVLQACIRAWRAHFAFVLQEVSKSQSFDKYSELSSAMNCLLNASQKDRSVGARKREARAKQYFLLMRSFMHVMITSC
jgi:hypothetical protein